MDFPRKSPEETLTVSFDFSVITATLDTASVSIVRCSGFEDAAPGTMLDGEPVIDGARVLQRVTGGVDGTRYELIAIASKGGETFRLTGYLPVLSIHYTTR